MRLDPARDNLFSMRDEVAHAKLRTKMAAGVSWQFSFFPFSFFPFRSVMPSKCQFLLT